ncbi:MAG: hypothetical protein EWV40_14775 [Microcystis flos-aquae Mf_WU_F_19750830_S460]|uniref:Uncharacterized protein n=1 Tax=Microcystis flos-aquae Mf_WU_F_19750830_S460 TaxID=2486237 RepID=A0A552LI51_9CHRO|nr:MAG: hypothetical protein EWV40_14775 [Microcystis flos-aquae Mf_WU_F_19750830_S460]
MACTKSCLKGIGKWETPERGETIHNLGVNHSIKNGFALTSDRQIPKRVIFLYYKAKCGIGARSMSKITGFGLILIYSPIHRSDRTCGLYQQVLLGSQENYQLSSEAR